MSRPTRLALLCLSAALLAFPLTLGKPGLPTNLKADESAYYLMALSLAHDGDLELTPRDVARAFQEFPFAPVNNMIVMSDDGWRTVHFGKPYIYPLLAAPFAAVAGANGMLLFNLLLVVAMIWMGAAYLGRHNDEATAALYSAAFVLLSAAFAYAFWLQPEVFNMASIAACLFLGLRPAEESPRRTVWLAALSGAALAFATYNKPVYGALGLPVLWLLARQRWWRGAGAWLAGAVVGMAAIAGGAAALTGHPIAYLGVVRQGVSLCRPDEMPIGPGTGIRPEAVRAGGAVAAPGGAEGGEDAAPETTGNAEPAGVAGEDAQPDGSAGGAAAGREGTAPEAENEGPSVGTGGRPAAAGPGTMRREAFRSNSWAWLFRIPKLTVWDVLENTGYFLWGRHTGLLLYLPFAALSVLLFLLHARRSSERWVLLACLAVVAYFFLLFISFNWHGGGGFLGNRYFIPVYPAFLFLVTRVKPRWLLALGCAAGGMLLGPMLLSPFGLPAPEPTLQAHVRNFPHRLLPLELSLRNIPGYERIPVGGGVRAVGRRDLFLPQGGELWMRGASHGELWLISTEPLSSLVFAVRNPAPDNPIELTVGEAREVVDLPAGGSAQIELRPGSPDRVRRQRNGTWYVYRLLVEPRTGRMQPWTREIPPGNCGYFASETSRRESFFLGAALTWLGDAEHLAADVYGVEWDRAPVPAHVRAGERFTMPVRLYNRGRATWREAGLAQVALSYHWLDAEGRTVVRDGERTLLRLPVPPGQRTRALARIVAPREPGRYTLELDLVFEGVAWFSDRGAPVHRAQVEVLPADGAAPAEPGDAGTPAGGSKQPAPPAPDRGGPEQGP